jgi:hypothetical protein
MIVLRFGIQGKDILSLLMASVMCLHFSMQEADMLEVTGHKIDTLGVYFAS